MTNYKFSILIISIFLSAILLPISYAQAPAVITNFTVLDPNGNDVTDEFLVAGGSYTINFEIEIGATLSDNILLYLFIFILSHNDLIFHNINIIINTIIYNICSSN